MRDKMLRTVIKTVEVDTLSRLHRTMSAQLDNMTEDNPNYQGYEWALTHVDVARQTVIGDNDDYLETFDTSQEGVTLDGLINYCEDYRGMKFPTDFAYRGKNNDYKCFVAYAIGPAAEILEEHTMQAMDTIEGLKDDQV